MYKNGRILLLSFLFAVIVIIIRFAFSLIFNWIDNLFFYKTAFIGIGTFCIAWFCLSYIFMEEEVK
ncbi:MAG: hypothetical protein AB1765_05770, partial [Candidatus Hydrogenedentota bacterium]